MMRSYASTSSNVGSLFGFNWGVTGQPQKKGGKEENIVFGGKGSWRRITGNAFTKKKEEKVLLQREEE